MRAVVVCPDVETAHQLLLNGNAVVLFGHDGEALGRAAAALRKSPGGRLAVFVGDPENEADREAVRALAAEQFGAGSLPVRISEET